MTPREHHAAPQPVPLAAKLNLCFALRHQPPTPTVSHDEFGDVGMLHRHASCWLNIDMNIDERAKNLLSVTMWCFLGLLPHLGSPCPVSRDPHVLEGHIW